MCFQSIQITATTPTNNAVRLETGSVELDLSNRVKRVTKLSRPGEGVEAKNEAKKDLKVFVRARVSLNLALGTLLKNPMFEEAESEFQYLASFETRITLRNALQASKLILLVLFIGNGSIEVGKCLCCS